MSRSRPTVLFLIAAILLGGCNNVTNNGENKKASESGSETLTLNGDAVITLDVKSDVGTVTIRAGDSGQVKVDYKKTTYAKTDDDAREEVKNMTVKIEQWEKGVSVDTFQTKYRDHPNTNTVDLVITVPASTNLVVQNDVGNVNITGITAPDKLTVRGDVGSMSLTHVIAPAGMSLQVNVGSVIFDGSLAGTGSCAITADTGSIDVRLPADTAINIDAVADTGSVKVKGFPVHSTTLEESWKGTLGKGDNLPTLTLRTDTGSISITAQP